MPGNEKVGTKFLWNKVWWTYKHPSQVFGLQHWDVTQLNPVMVIIFAVYITPVFWRAKLTSQVLYNETSPTAWERKVGAFILLERKIRRNGKCLIHIFIIVQESNPLDFFIISCLKKWIPFQDNKYLFATEVLIGICFTSW